mgnify:FL=1
MQKKYSVYWIHRRGDIDIMSDGYIGVTDNLNRRVTQHNRYNVDNPRLRRALDKYDDIVVDQITIGSHSYCFDLEHQLRPDKLIGWNIAEGGDCPPSASGRQWSDEHRSNYMNTIAQNNSNYRTPEQRKRQIETRRNNGYVEGQNLDPEAVRNTHWWNNGKENKRAKQSPGPGWTAGRLQFNSYGTVKTCPHCGKEGKGSGMVRFHYDNCKEKQ